MAFLNLLLNFGLVVGFLVPNLLRFIAAPAFYLAVALAFFKSTFHAPPWLALFASAFVVHLWLPLFLSARARYEASIIYG